MSEQDIKNGKLISQEAMDKRNLEQPSCHKPIENQQALPEFLYFCALIQNSLKITQHNGNSEQVQSC